MNGQAAGDLWHLTIDDLLAAPADAPRLQGPGPFVINLSASTAPIDVPAAGLKGYEQLLLYQLKQTEDGRTRFRLRLGPIASELEADAILSALRELYPSAFATNAAEDDLKVFERKGARTAEAAKPAPNTQPAAPAVALDAAGEVEAEIELPPAKPAAPAGKGVAGKAHPATKATKPAPHSPKGANGAKTAPPGAGGTAPIEDSAEFAIDFDAFLPPMDLPAQATAPPSAPVTGSGKRKKREHKSTRHAKVARHEAAKAAKPEAVKVANPEAAKAVAAPTQPEPTVAKRPEPAKFVEPAPDPNAVTDQVAVLAVPDVAGELTLDDAVESMIVPVLSDAPEHDLDMSGVVPALQIPPPAPAPAPAEDHDLASVVAKNNAMVEALVARNDQPAAQTEVTAPETVPAPAVAAAPASALPATTPAVPPTADVLAAIAAAPTVKDVEAVEATAILQVQAPADIEADVDDFTSTIVGVEGEQEIEALLDDVPTLVPVPSEALAQVSSEPEPPELVEVVEPKRAVRRSEPPVAAVAEQAEPVTLTEAVEIPKRAPVPAATRPAVAEPAIEVTAVEVPAVEVPPVDVEVAAANPAALEVSAPETEVARASAVAPVAELTLVPDEPVATQNAAQPATAESVVELASLEDRLPAEKQPEASVPLPHADIVEVLEVLQASEPAPAALERTEPAIEPATVAQAPKAAKILSEPLPEVDSTQTIRELTPLELADDQASQYFAIQLSLSDEAVNQDEVPHLDIFDAYRLYCVAGMHQGTFKHALRLGFFSDAGSAGAVAGYLRCYFDSPEVTRVANAERERFSQQRVVPRRDIGATGRHTIIELSTAARVPERRLAEISNNPSHRASDSGSLWSRLVAPLKR